MLRVMTDATPAEFPRDEIRARIVPQLLAYAEDLARWDETSGDVRLVYFADGSYSLATGDASYDTEHGDACGASEVSPDLDEDQATEIADDLIAQVEDQIAV